MEDRPFLSLDEEEEIRKKNTEIPVFKLFTQATSAVSDLSFIWI